MLHWSVNFVPSVDTPNILNCNEDRAFWLDWNNETIRLGRGADVGPDAIFEVKSHGLI